MKAILSSLLLLVNLAPVVVLAQNPIDAALRALENEQMQRLAAQQRRPEISIDPFNSDGCSGGMSDSWKTVTRIWPELARAIGEEPPWEPCCAAHDRDYWRGESIDGFEKRLQSDLRLRQCVERTGRDQGEAIARRLRMSPAEIVEIIDLTAEWMFYAVRIGGGPCTGLVWRWGHGWPPCHLDAVPAGDPAAPPSPRLFQVRADTSHPASIPLHQAARFPLGLHPVIEPAGMSPRLTIALTPRLN